MIGQSKNSHSSRILRIGYGLLAALLLAGSGCVELVPRGNPAVTSDSAAETQATTGEGTATTDGVASAAEVPAATDMAATVDKAQPTGDAGEATATSDVTGDTTATSDNAASQ